MQRLVCDCCIRPSNATVFKTDTNFGLALGHFSSSGRVSPRNTTGVFRYFSRRFRSPPPLQRTHLRRTLTRTFSKLLLNLYGICQSTDMYNSCRVCFNRETSWVYIYIKVVIPYYSWTLTRPKITILFFLYTNLDTEVFPPEIHKGFTF